MTEPSPSLLESPISPTASSFHPIAPSIQNQPCLVDLKDWILEDGPKKQQPRPPLPPRKPSQTLTIDPGPRKFGAGRVAHTSASSVSSFHSVSLSSDSTNIHPDTSPTASIADSFEHISRFDTSPRPAPKTAPPVPPKPLARSLSVSSSLTATSTKTRRPPPPPPYQPRSRPPSSRASVVSTSASTSDRSSIRSNATTTSRTSNSTPDSAQCPPPLKSSLLRPTPVPPAAQLRYRSLFESAVRGRRVAAKKANLPSPSQLKGRQASGWRGLSVDLITSPEDHPLLSLRNGLGEGDDSSSVPPEEKLNGRIVKHIWSASRLDHKKLASIWNDCDPRATGFVDRDAFVRGMWRIDEELRRSQLARHTPALSAASSQRIPHRPLPPPRPQRPTQLLI